MKLMNVRTSRVINARPDDIYNIIADYHAGHQAILPEPYFKEMTLEEGGYGAGTVIRVVMKVFGRTYRYHMIVTEPKPGRIIVETDLHTGQESRFIITPVDGGQKSDVTIAATFPGKPGLAGLMERLFKPRITRSIFDKELQKLAEYIHNQRVTGVMQPQP